MQISLSPLQERILAALPSPEATISTAKIMERIGISTRQTPTARPSLGRSLDWPSVGLFCGGARKSLDRVAETCGRELFR
jgi:hypothetical protein